MRAALGLGLVLSVLPLTADPTGRDIEVATSFELGHQGGIIVPVFLNGQGPFRFLLDTGSTHSAVSDAVAGEIGAPAVARADVGSVIGSRQRIVVRVDRFDSGPVTVTGLLPSVVDMDEVGPSARIQGVIGQDVLAPLRYTIDFKQRRLVWWPKQNAEPFVRATTFALESSGGRFLVSLPQRGFVLRLVPDSGAETLLLFARDELRSLSYLAGPAELTTLSARRTVRQARVHELQVGRTTLRDIPAVVVGRNIDERPGSPQPDGLLPLHLFERVTFDGPRGQIVLQAGT